MGEGMATGLADRVVAITGATGDLGPVVAHRFAEAGARCCPARPRRGELCGLGDVAAWGAPPPPGDRGRPVGWLVHAVGSRDDPRELGPASVLLHRGGYAGGSPFVETDDAELRQQLELNLWTTGPRFGHSCRTSPPRSMAGSSSVSTFVAATPTAKHAAYAASKAAAEALTISVARDLAGTTATANIVVVRVIGDAKPSETDPTRSRRRWCGSVSPGAGATNGQRIQLIGRA